MTLPKKYHMIASTLCGLLVFAGCSELLTDSRPVPDSTMIEILTEMHIVEARGRLFSDLPPSPSDSLLRRHHLDRMDFEKALDFYTKHPQAYRAVYDSVVDRISEKRQLPP